MPTSMKLNSVNPDRAAKDLDAALRALLRRIIRNCPKKREQIAEELRARGFAVTSHTLNDYTAEGREGKGFGAFPLKLIQAFCEVVGDDRLQRYAAGPRLARAAKIGEDVAEVLSERKRKSRRK